MSEIDPLVSIPAAASEIGVGRQTLWKQVKAGRVRSHVGPGGRRLVRISEVKRDRRAWIMSYKRPRGGPAGSDTAKRKTAKPPVSDYVHLHHHDGTVSRVPAAEMVEDLEAEYGSLEAACEAAENGMIPVPLIDVASLCAWLAEQTAAGLKAKRRKVRIPLVDRPVDRADAEKLLAAYRAGDIDAVGELHRRIAPDA